MADELDDQQIDKLKLDTELAIRRARRIVAAFHGLVQIEAHILHDSAANEENSSDPDRHQTPAYSRK